MCRERESFVAAISSLSHSGTVLYGGKEGRRGIQCCKYYLSDTPRNNQFEKEQGR